MREQLVQFGEDGRLAGILSPAQNDEQNTPVLVFLNAGIVHRIGPNRLHVKLARAFSAQGFPCLRFDLSGLGESPAAAPGLGYEQQSVVDVTAAVDFVMGRLGERPVILAGICSGADNGYRVALLDERIRGLILLDPYAYQNTTAQISDLAKRAQDPARWRRLAGKLTSGTQHKQAEEEFFEDDNDRVAPPKEEFGADLETLATRNVQICLLYTSSVSHLINDKVQFGKTFGKFDFGSALSVDVLSHVDHIYTELSAQSELADRIRGWLKTTSFR